MHGGNVPSFGTKRSVTEVNLSRAPETVLFQKLGSDIPKWPYLVPKKKATNIMYKYAKPAKWQTRLKI